jgi:hypothetical protein
MPFVGTTSSGSQRHFGFTYGAKPVWTDSTLANFGYNTAYSDSVVASGTAPVTYSVVSGSLPTGISLNSSTGLLSGTTSASGTYDFVIQARNHLGAITQSFSRTVPQAPEPPTLVARGNSSVGATWTITMPTRQSGDLAVVLLNSYSTSTATYENADPPGWTRAYGAYFGASVLRNDGNTIDIQYGHVRVYYRVMNNTSADNFTYNLPSSMFWTGQGQYMILRPAAGMAYTVTGGDRGGQTGNIIGNPIQPPSNSWLRVATLASSSNPRSAMLNYFALGMSVNSGPTASFATGSDGWASSISSSTAMTNLAQQSYLAYTTNITDATNNGIYIGTFSYNGPPNYWYMNGFAVIEWTRVS